MQVCYVLLIVYLSSYLYRYKNWKIAYDNECGTLKKVEDDSSSGEEKEMGGVKIRKFVPNSGVPVTVETSVREDTVSRVKPISNRKTKKQKIKV